ncbi:hypothetical protein O6H91_04G035600 [Diphasiastrum complanatum]|uniref:Uncharacterized protein n=1 Tax=Diphasiastrum complanatum TaxID=34168 RepID=A0ACC2DVK7_DIPCM|nr:hypothetical protein O6H91_04G035600 [Diphasiastrum complanatum]
MATLVESDAENCEDSVRQGVSSASYLLRSKSLAIGKGSSMFGRSSLNVNSNACQLQAHEEEISFHVQAKETVAKAKELESTLAMKENNDTQRLLCSNESSKEAASPQKERASQTYFILIVVMRTHPKPLATMNLKIYALVNLKRRILFKKLKL